MLSHIFVALISITGLAVAQSIDPNTIPKATRDQWCQQQKTSCPLICLQLPNSTAAESNKCDPTTLDYSCICDNGQSPNSSEYSQTIPYFICTAYNSQCQDNCHGDAICQSDCVQKHPCGAQDPTRYNVTSTAATASATATATGSSTGDAGDVVYTGWGTAAGAAATSSTAGNAGGPSRPLFVEGGQVYGLMVLVAGLIGGMAVIL